MYTITDTDLHDSLCQICIDSPHSLLSELDENAKRKIIDTTVCLSYKKGELIYQEGNMPVGLLCLITGKVKIYKEGIGGRIQIVRMAKPIGFIGYRAFFAEEIHIASAEALEDSIICRIKTELILDIVRNIPELAMSIIRALATDLGFSNRRTVTLPARTQGHLRLRKRRLYPESMPHPRRPGEPIQHDHRQRYPHPIQLCLRRHRQTNRKKNKNHR